MKKCTISETVVIELRKLGCTYQTISNLLNTPLSTIHAIGNKDKKELWKEKHKEYQRKHIVVTSDNRRIKGNKRVYPTNGCELCNKIGKRLVYHHWNSNRLEHGIWICYMCHYMVHGVEQQLHTKYLKLKEGISNK